MICCSQDNSFSVSSRFQMLIENPIMRRLNSNLHIRKQKRSFSALCVIRANPALCVCKIISRRNALAEMKAEYDDSWPLEQAADLHHHHQPPCDRAPGCLKPDLWVKTATNIKTHSVTLRCYSLPYPKDPGCNACEGLKCRNGNTPISHNIMTTDEN